MAPGTYVLSLLAMLFLSDAVLIDISQKSIHKISQSFLFYVMNFSIACLDLIYISVSFRILNQKVSITTKKDDIPTKRIPRRSTKIGGVYTPDRRLKKLFQSCRKPKYTPLADLEKAQFQEFQSILRENPAQ